MLDVEYNQSSQVAACGMQLLECAISWSSWCGQKKMTAGNYLPIYLLTYLTDMFRDEVDLGILPE